MTEHDHHQHQHQHDRGAPCHSQGQGRGAHDKAAEPHDEEARDQAHDHGSGLAELLDLDAAVLGSYLAELTAWAAQHTPDPVSAVVDVGAGTGTAAVALARHFQDARVVALDRSPEMLERIKAATERQGLAERLRALPGDLDAGWPDVGPVDLAWASSCLHELSDPDRVLDDLHAALRPGGLLVVVELDALPRFLPHDLGHGRPGLEDRCHQALVQAGWNAHPDWRPHLQRGGFWILEQRTVTTASHAQGRAGASDDIGQYARAYLRRIRFALDGRLNEDDLATLDLLLCEDHPDALSRRIDLTARSSRTAWAARRP